MLSIITHRGLDAEANHLYTESSKEAFSYFLNDGYGVEFDIQITKDFIPVISHDESLSRLTGKKELAINEISAVDFSNTELSNGHTITLTELIELIKKTSSENIPTHALHLKYKNQNQVELETLVPYLSELAKLPIILFDAKPSVAKYLKKQLPFLNLAASVAHPSDINRYSEIVGGTLLSLDEIVQYTDIYSWVWLDEWDRTTENNEVKTLYNQKNFSFLKELGLKIAVVSPELHRTSPNLIGIESHEDAENISTLEKRWLEIIDLAPDAICTDYPYRISKLIS